MALRIRIGGYQDEQSVHTRAVRVLIAALARIAGDEIGVEFIRNIADQNRKVSDLLGMVQSGELDLCYFSSSYLTGRVPALGALDIPFLSGDRAETRRRLHGELGALLAAETAARTEYEVLAFWDNGLRNLSNSKRPIRTPDDCAGLKIRTLPNATYHAAFRALGMEPVTIDVGDMVRAISAGEVDAQENPLTNIQLFGLDRYHPFVTMTGHFHGIAAVLGNAASMSGWPDDVRRALREAIAEATEAQWRFAVEDDDISRRALEAKGLAIVDLDGSARAAFRAQVSGVIEQSVAALPAGVVGLLGGARYSPPI